MLFLYPEEGNGPPNAPRNGKLGKLFLAVCQVSLNICPRGLYELRCEFLLLPLSPKSNQFQFILSFLSEL